MGRKKQGGQKPLVGVRMSEVEQQHLDVVAVKLAERTGGTPNRADVFRLGVRLVEQGADTGGVHVPLCGVVSAGDGAGEEYPPGTLLSVPKLCPPGTVAYRVKGDSMADHHIIDGDYVLVRPHPDGAVGEVVVVWVPDCGTVVKLKRKKHYASANDAKPRNPIPCDGCKEYGVLVGVIRKC